MGYSCTFCGTVNDDLNPFSICICCGQPFNMNRDEMHLDIPRIYEQPKNVQCE